MEAEDLKSDTYAAACGVGSQKNSYETDKSCGVLCE